jgi:hypothetical protein
MQKVTTSVLDIAKSVFRVHAIDAIGQRSHPARRDLRSSAEGAVPRMLFTAILRLIAELRPPPDPTAA